MKRFTSALCATLAFAMTASTALPAAAAPLLVQPAQAQSAAGDVIQVQNRKDRERRFERRQERRERRFERRQDRREARFERRGNYAYYNNHRGYRERRPGYRQYNGYWFPPAAFIAGAIIGGALGNNAVTVRPSGSAHVQWCYNRYRSYRASDNTFQPYNGPRQQCYSPYS
ncbi:BA14K family protein [Aquibium microcysteis]|uniref:BA14K family protein n=1 Tax=Aquibium microcysteis TaxID=675281 RepID=UPI00165CF1A3|nr:BA14K family protein [Aquibium microcysteis]